MRARARGVGVGGVGGPCNLNARLKGARGCGAAQEGRCPWASPQGGGDERRAPRQTAAHGACIGRADAGTGHPTLPLCHRRHRSPPLPPQARPAGSRPGPPRPRSPPRPSLPSPPPRSCESPATPRCAPRAGTRPPGPLLRCVAGPSRRRTAPRRAAACVYPFKAAHATLQRFIVQAPPNAVLFRFPPSTRRVRVVGRSRTPRALRWRRQGAGASGGGGAGGGGCKTLWGGSS
jgi:hypothetical protein